ncbi:prenyltransferase [Candidatus Woesebacteria bacterium]|nr:prenyltransferase [Candidatus Woesebacteria bacterium]MCD8507480.1 prenyltransferase [Candidatus Woesebacteria bacterium]MCD8526934.1 prenyltransferase [Candidatus Woesebacteria bacterium]MCD8545834.1 prenyltransferase [Candidatus Woesebacteria bacterium]
MRPPTQPNRAEWYWLRVSRPRFWLYLLGPSLVGVVAATDTWQVWLNPVVWFWLLFFTWPANVFLYGVNDLFDQDTDAHNTKKHTYETRFATRRSRQMQRLLAVIALAGLGAGFGLLPLNSWLILGAWFVLSWTYSAPPLRWKSRPFLDAYSNGLYILPAVLVFVWLSGSWPPAWAILAGWCWSVGMHTFSAIPDIAADQAGGVHTTATVLGRGRALLWVAGHWLVAIGLASTGLQWWAGLGVLYPAVALYLWFRPKESVFSWYVWFPYINAVLGMALFWWVYAQ